MADIAILVAEEYERRVKSSRKAGDDKMEFSLVSSCAYIMAQKLKNKIGNQENLKIPKWVLEPKTQIGLQASTGFFSA